MGTGTDLTAAGKPADDDIRVHVRRLARRVALLEIRNNIVNPETFDDLDDSEVLALTGGTGRDDHKQQMARRRDEQEADKQSYRQHVAAQAAAAAAVVPTKAAEDKKKQAK